jgi:quinolinate synthase
VSWARTLGKKILFVPDQHLGRNTAFKLGMDLERVALLPDPRAGAIRIEDTDGGLARLDDAEMILWGSSCGVHTIFTAARVEWWAGASLSAG